TFDSNQANDHAGAVFGYTTPGKPSTTIIDRCTFDGNRVNGGHGQAGGMYSLNGTLTLSNSTFSGNQGTSNGGGVAIANSSSLVANCTFQGNSAVLGAGIHNGAGNLSVINVTLAQNAASAFAGALWAPLGTATIQNSILSFNTGVNAAAGTQVNESCAGGANIQAPVGNKPASSSGTTFTANAMLGALANNGGTTQTMKPSAGSPVINLAGVTGAPLLDQAGNPRNGAPDAGACEGP
ncbi:MAG TPA: choice-of-anchor Q domain-containing protein, partial [Planctomycetota bacterium]|nr:choice-of-anchor Q domain-containing protein [Planctomycetota bacterium]